MLHHTEQSAVNDIESFNKILKLLENMIQMHDLSMILVKMPKPMANFKFFAWWLFLPPLYSAVSQNSLKGG